MKAARLKELRRMEKDCAGDPYSYLFAKNYWDKGQTLRAIRQEIQLHQQLTQVDLSKPGPG